MMHKTHKIIMTFIVMLAGAAMVYIASRIGVQPDWFNTLIGYVGIALFVGATIYLDGFFSGSHGYRNYNNKDWE
jgi:hypothetical protein